jgi:hypothetical protein
MRYIKAILLLATLLLSSSGCAIFQHYGPYYGKVIDAETKEPLEGAAVLVKCYTQSYGPGGSNSNYVDARETVTDKNGEFRIPAFTIWTFRPLQNFASYVWFTIFKPGYGCYPECKGVNPNFMPPGNLPSKKHVAIALPKLRTREERVKMPSVDYDIPYEKQKIFLNLMNQEMEFLGARGIYNKESFERR